MVQVAAAVWMQSLAWELPHTTVTAEKKKKEKKKKFFNSDIHLLGPISPQYITNFVICKFLFLVRSKKEKYREENSHLLFFSTGRMGLEL